MSFEKPLFDLSLKSSGDMSSNQYRIVKASTTNAVDSATRVATRGGALTGVWQDNSTATTFGKVLVGGVSKVAAGDSSAMENAINAGDYVVASSVGQAVPSTASDQHVLGQALESLSTGSTGIIAVLINPRLSS